VALLGKLLSQDRVEMSANTPHSRTSRHQPETRSWMIMLAKAANSVNGKCVLLCTMLEMLGS
jgi:hypothetical protein